MAKRKGCQKDERTTSGTTANEARVKLSSEITHPDLRGVEFVADGCPERLEIGQQPRRVRHQLQHITRNRASTCSVRQNMKFTVRLHHGVTNKPKSQVQQSRMQAERLLATHQSQHWPMKCLCSRADLRCGQPTSCESHDVKTSLVAKADLSSEVCSETC